MKTINTSRLLTASLMLSLVIASGCGKSTPLQLVETKPKPFKELVAENTPPLDQIQVEPNPLTLVVDIDLEGRLTLNRESMGIADNPKRLRKRLKEIFAERERNHAYEPGSDTKIAKSVFVKAPRSLRYVVVVKVIDAIKAAGGNPIGLQIDDLTEGQR